MDPRFIRKIRNRRLGDRLQDGQAHADDHANWSRRDFLFRIGAAAGGATVVLNGFPMRALAGGSLLTKLKSLETDRVLVLIQLKGGNDGLNTVIPVNDSEYYNARSNIAIPRQQSLILDYQTGLHPGMSEMIPLWQTGDLGILRNVGYPSPNLSHFRATDIWMSASASNEYIPSGWVGRSLETAYPDLDEEPLDYPLAVQIGTTSSLLFHGNTGDMGMTIKDIQLFHQIVRNGTIWDEDDVPETHYGDELGYIRSVANNAITYADALRDANGAVETEVDYPNTTFGESLAVVSRLIRGGLGAKIYTVSLSGFDTHSNQLTAHNNLLTQIGEALSAFQEDLQTGGATDRVLTMTFSEFGRRIRENASAGTDHGTSAPMFLVGPGVKGGLHGVPPNLDPSSLDSSGNPVFDMDFRSVYATVLKDWFGMHPIDVAQVLGDDFPSLGFVAKPIIASNDDNIPAKFELAQNYPNPFNPSTRISFTLERSSDVRLQVYDLQGRAVSTLVDGPVSSGKHEFTFDAGSLASGAYIYRLDTPGGYVSRKMILVR